MGKVYALHVASQKATGDWLLFTNADAHFRPGVLRKTIAICLKQQLDHLAIAAEAYSQSFWLDVALAAFALSFFTGTKAEEIGKPESDSFAGFGSFNLVQKSLFDQTKGFSWFRMEVIDDVGPGLMLHRVGAKSCLLLGMNGIGLTWYSSLPAMMRGLGRICLALSPNIAMPNYFRGLGCSG